MKVTLTLGKKALAYGWGVNYNVPPRPPTWYAPIFAPDQPAYAGPKRGKHVKKKRTSPVIKTEGKKKVSSKDGIGNQPSEVKTMKNDDVILKKKREHDPVQQVLDIRN